LGLQIRVTAPLWRRGDRPDPHPLDKPPPAATLLPSPIVGAGAHRGHPPRCPVPTRPHREPYNGQRFV